MRSSNESTSLNTGIPRKAGCDRGDPGAIDQVALEPRPRLDELNSVATHGEGGCSKTVGLVDIGADDRQAHNLLDRLGRSHWIVDMLATDSRSRGCYPLTRNT